MKTSLTVSRKARFRLPEGSAFGKQNIAALAASRKRIIRTQP